MNPRLKTVWLLCLHALLAVSSVHAADWPSVALPKEARSFDVAEQITHNGLPMRLQGFLSSTPPDELIELFRRGMGKPLVENRWGRQRILGHMQGEFYVSVQIESAGQGSRGMVAVTHLKGARDSEQASGRDVQLWRSRLPAGSQLLSHMASRDGTKHSLHLVFVNSHDEALNADRLKSMLSEQGLTFEREDSPGLAANRTLFFKGRDKEALATIHRDDAAQTSVVLNVVTQLGKSR